MKENDLRILKTKERIDDVFETLLMEKEFEQITVKELCQRAQIARKTFYAHYASLDELLSLKQDQMAKDFIERIKDYKIEQDLDQITREFFLSCLDDQGLREKLLNNSNGTYIAGKVTRDILAESWKTAPFEDELVKEIAMTFVSRSTLAIYRKWIEQGKKIPVEKIIELTSTFVGQGLDGFFNEKEKENPSRGG